VPSLQSKKFKCKSLEMCLLGHGPLKLRTVHLSDNTIIYESKISAQNVFSLI
jgi:hypothetical protein